MYILSEDWAYCPQVITSANKFDKEVRPSYEEYYLTYEYKAPKKIRRARKNKNTETTINIYL